MPNIDEVALPDPNDPHAFDIDNIPVPQISAEEKEQRFQKRLKEIESKMDEEEEKHEPVGIDILAAMSAALLEQAPGTKQARQQQHLQENPSGKPRRDQTLDELLPPILDALAALCCHKAKINASVHHSAAVLMGIDDKERKVEIVVADNDNQERLQLPDISKLSLESRMLLDKIEQVDPDKTVKFLNKIWSILRRITNRNARLLLKQLEEREKRRGEEDAEGREEQKAIITTLKKDTETEKTTEDKETKEEEEETDIFGLGLELAEYTTQHLHDILRYKINRRQERFFEFLKGFRENVLPNMDEELREDFGDFFNSLLTDMAVLNAQINHKRNEANWPRITSILLNLHTAYDDESDLAALLDEPSLLENWCRAATPDKKPFSIRFFINELIVFPRHTDILFRAAVHPHTRHLFGYTLTSTRLKSESRSIFLPTSQTGWKRKLDDFAHEQHLDLALDEQMSLKLWMDYASLSGPGTLQVHNEPLLLAHAIAHPSINPHQYIGTSHSICSFCRLVFKAHAEIEQKPSFRFREGPTKLEFPWVMPIIWAQPKDRGDQQEAEQIVKRELEGRFAQRLLVSGKAKRRKAESLEEPAEAGEGWEH